MTITVEEAIYLFFIADLILIAGALPMICHGLSTRRLLKKLDRVPKRQAR